MGVLHKKYGTRKISACAAPTRSRVRGPLALTALHVQYVCTIISEFLTFAFFLVGVGLVVTADNQDCHKNLQFFWS